jgi:mRNA (guanine-N7-)-methyltransferase
MKVQCLQNFHDAVKRQMLRSTVQAGNQIADLAMGRAEDLNKWISANVSYVFGCDVAAAAINDPDTGAYRKVLDKMVALGSRESVPPMAFAVADAARILKTGEAGLSGEDQGLLRSEFAGRAAAGFDVVSCMFALHYMFRDAPTLLGFLNNLADLVKVGGYFVGCGHDGDSMARLLATEKTVVGSDGRSDTWSLSKSYGSGALRGLGLYQCRRDTYGISGLLALSAGEVGRMWLGAGPHRDVWRDLGLTG